MDDNPLLNKDYCYHGIHGDIFRLLPILDHGILPQRELETLNMPENSLKGYGYNGTDKVSVIISPQFCGGPDTLGGGYSDGITFVCKSPYTKDFTSGIPFEGHVSEISRKNITGIILPEELYKKPIREYRKFGCGWGNLPAVCEKFKEFMNNECNYKARDYRLEIARIRAAKDSLKLHEYIENLGKSVFEDLQKAIDKKLGKTDSTFAEIVSYYIKDTDLKLYNREELQKEVKRPENCNNIPRNYRITPKSITGSKTKKWYK